MTDDKELAQAVQRIGTGIKRKLDEQFNQWGNGIEYRKLFNAYSTMVKKHNIDLTSFAYMLQDAGFIRMYNSPKGKRLVFSSDCPLSMAQIEDLLVGMEYKLEKTNNN